MPRVLNVGQCGLDHGNISAYLSQTFQADVIPAHSAEDAVRKCQSDKFDLVLVNRILDRDGSPGMDVLRRLKSEPASAATPVMLVSNYADAQAAAVEAGALPGFGKAELRSPETAARLRDVLGSA